MKIIIGIVVFKNDLDLVNYNQQRGKENKSENVLDNHFYKIGKYFFNAYKRLYKK